VIGGIVEQQIQYPSSAGLMPKLPLSTRQAADIAAYVQYASAKPGKDTGLLAAAGGSGPGPPAVEKDGKLAFAANRRACSHTRSRRQRPRPGRSRSR